MLQRDVPPEACLEGRLHSCHKRGDPIFATIKLKDPLPHPCIKTGGCAWTSLVRAVSVCESV